MEKSNLIIIELEVLAKLTKPELIKLYSVVLAKGISSGGETLISAKALMKELNISERTLRRRRNTLMKLKLLKVYRTNKEETWCIAVGFLNTLAKNNKSEVIIPQQDNTQVDQIGHEVVQNGHADVRNGQELSEDKSVSEPDNALVDKQLEQPKRKRGRPRKILENRIVSVSIDDSVSNANDSVSIDSPTIHKESIDSTDSIESSVVSKGLSLPTNASTAFKQEHKFPYEKTPIQVSVIWYWAIERYRKHNKDVELHANIFKKWAITYHRNFAKIFGNKWEDHKAYVDWYLANTDSFIADKCGYGFDFFSSMPCYNKKLSEKKTPRSFIQHKGDLETIEKLMEKIREA